MDVNHHIWHIWVSNLQRWGVHELTATFLETAGPLSILGAQVIYLGQPLLNIFLSSDYITALADLLDDTTQTRAFVSHLREYSIGQD
jgi:hypothetical protein